MGALAPSEKHITAAWTKQTGTLRRPRRYNRIVNRNIDERLDALTQTVELVAQMHKDNEVWMKERTAQLMEWK